MTVISLNKACIKPLEFKKIENKVQGGMARIQQRVVTAEGSLVCDLLIPVGSKVLRLHRGDKIIVSGEAALAPWNKNVMETEEGVKFVQCPLTEIIGYKTDDLRIS